MKRTRRIAFSVVLITLYPTLAADEPALTRFDGDSVVRVYVENDAQLATIEELTNDVWSHRFGVGPVDIRVSLAGRATLDALGWDYDVLIPDVQALVDTQPRGVNANAGVGGLFDDYQPLDVVHQHLLTLANQRPDLAERIQIGTSLRNRAMYVIHITGPGDSSDRPDVFIHAGIHAREWITVASVLYLADRLVNDYDSDSYVQRVVDQANWYIMPVMNPDGYAYSWTNNRLWRKNRRSSFGVDLNRNYDVNWGGIGSSGNPGSQTYHGSGPFSEPETQVVRDFVLSLPNFVGYFDVHSYSQLLMWPWGPTPALPADNEKYEAIGQEMVKLIRDVNGRTYVPGPIYTTIYPVSGGSIDWAYQDTGAFSLTFELRDTGEAGFLLPPNQIIPNAEEVFPSFLHFVDRISTPIEIDYPLGVPASISPAGSNVVVAVASADASLSVADVRAFVRVSPDTTFVEQTPTAVGDERYEISLPAAECGEAIEFYVDATRSDGKVVSELDGALGDAHVVRIGQRAVAAAAAFDGPEGWNWAGFIPPSGRWIHGTPTGTFDNGVAAEPKSGNPFGSGGACWSTQPATDNDAESSDVDGGPTILFGAYYDTSGMVDPIFGYWRWHYSSGYVTLDVDITGDDGTQRVVERPGTTEGWEYVEFRLRDFFPNGTDGFRLLFTVHDLDGTNSITESAVDDFVLYDVVCDATLVGDTNCDGLISVGDIGPFVLALTDPAGYAAQYPDCDINNADVNEDGVVSVGDIGPFVGLVTGG